MGLATVKSAAAIPVGQETIVPARRKQTFVRTHWLEVTCAQEEETACATSAAALSQMNKE